jgi:Asp-tRNA(Asn)/Glu-tRNA(Gln) amidotransferase C subunit
MTKKSLIGVIVALLLLGTTGPIEAFEEVPNVLGEDARKEDLAQFIDDRQLLVLHESRSIPTPNGEKDVRFVSSMMVVDTPLEDVRQAVTNYENYTNFLPTLENVTTSPTDGDTEIVELAMELRLGVVNPMLYYTLEYYPGSGDDLLFRRKKGDISASYGRWEFESLPDGRTLVAYTNWSDFSNLGLTVDTVLWAQPDLKLAIPVSQTAVVMKNLREHVAQKPDRREATEAPTDPDVPLFSEGRVPDQLTEFARRGTPMIVHPEQTIRESSGDTLGLSFVSAVGVANGSTEDAKEYLTRFEKFPDFVNQVSSVQATKTDSGYRATWELSMGLGVMSVGIDYSLDYSWVNNDSLVFRRTAGDLTHVYGALEWIPIKENRTMFFYTTATQIGENAGYLLQLGNLIPNKQIVIGVSAGALAVEKQIDWANDQLE